MKKVEHPERQTLKAQIQELVEGADDHGLCMDDIAHRLGARGHGIFAFLLALPFVFPVPLPGLSTPSGVIIFFIGLAISLNREPWMPRKFRQFRVQKKFLAQIEAKLRPKLAWLERWLKPRWFDFSPSSWTVRVHGALMCLSALILALPAPPGGNVGPAGAILFFCLALLERDGVMTVVGTVLLSVGLAYFGGLATLMAGVWQ
jgi:hypothetical protein